MEFTSLPERADACKRSRLALAQVSLLHMGLTGGKSRYVVSSGLCFASAWFFAPRLTSVATDHWRSGLNFLQPNQA